MDINITANPNDQPVKIRVNQKLVAEVVGCVGDGAADFEKELARARALNLVPRLLSDLMESIRRAGVIADEGKTGQQKVTDFCEGLKDGMDGLLCEHPHGPDVPGFMRKPSTSYANGYAYGAALTRYQRAIAAEAEGSDI